MLGRGWGRHFLQNFASVYLAVFGMFKLCFVLYGQDWQEWQFLGLVLHQKCLVAGLPWTIWGSLQEMSPVLCWFTRVEMYKYTVIFRHFLLMYTMCGKSWYAVVVQSEIILRHCYYLLQHFSSLIFYYFVTNFCTFWMTWQTCSLLSSLVIEHYIKWR